MPSINDLGSRDVIGSYFRALESVQASAWLDAIGMRTTTDQAEEKYPFLGSVPVMQEWLAERNVARLRSDMFTVRNVHYESSIQFSKSELRRDKTGQIDIRVNEHVQRAQNHWNSLVTSLIVGGESSACYDGQFFFDTDHPNNGSGGTQSNDISVDISALTAAVHGSVTAPSPEEAIQSVYAAIKALVGLLDDQGEPMNEGAEEFIVICPLSLENALLTGNSIPNGTHIAELRNSRKIEIVSNVRLDSAGWTDKFMVARKDNPIKPFILQSETEINISALAEGSDFAHQNDAYQFGIDTWRKADYGQWQNAALATMV
jgi:phage major head subunit gpT-like protein